MADAEAGGCADQACPKAAEVECDRCGNSYCRAHAKHPEHQTPRDGDRGAPQIPSDDYGPE